MGLTATLTSIFSIGYLWLPSCFSLSARSGASHGNDAARSGNHRRADILSRRFGSDRRTHLRTNCPAGVCPPPKLPETATGNWELLTNNAVSNPDGACLVSTAKGAPPCCC